MIPIRDDNPTRHPPVVTVGLLLLIGIVWVAGQGAGLDPLRLAASVCNWGLVPGEWTGRAALGTAIPMGDGLACIVDAEWRNVLSPITAMFLHGGWAHVLGNALFLWIFGDNVEDRMGRLRFLLFYLLCGLAAAGVQTLAAPDSPVPMVGASGAISGVLGAYLVLFPKVRVHVLIFFFFIIDVIAVPAWVMLLLWFAVQLFSGLPQLTSIRPDVSSGVAFWAHVGGFLAGVLLAKLLPRRVNQIRGA